VIGPNEDIERAYMVRRAPIDNSPEAVERLRAEVLAPFGCGETHSARRDYALRTPGVCCVCGRGLLGSATVCTASSPCRREIRVRA